MANINDFKAKLAGGGARANQFKVTMPFPGYSQVGGEIEELAFLCKTTQLPAMTIPSLRYLSEVDKLRLLAIEHTLIGQLRLSMTLISN